MNHLGRTVYSLVLTAAFALLVHGIAAAQTAPPNISGGTSLVVSRASNPAPTVSSTPSLASALANSWRWNVIALANARVWAWSFAPALVASSTRPVAVRQGAIL